MSFTTGITCESFFFKKKKKKKKKKNKKKKFKKKKKKKKKKKFQSTHIQDLNLVFLMKSKEIKMENKFFRNLFYHPFGFFRPLKNISSHIRTVGTLYIVYIVKIH